ncbi:MULTISPECIES: exonuclease domain-containing protein [Bacteria]|uniref:Exonuclease domain-containing protein n=1 Tax=Cronobacter phage vB_CsaM_GAP31 TaxID=1141135 RepID=K4F5C2_9CAUD|nr:MULTISPECIES: exonuclease domain-containing protein [Bacteria]YP_006986986.1 DNA polymerase exonuclease subunit [Cronobacter phage vB_CsaM_GAP31]AFC21331.1 hypothetical protein GAP31_149 [Cronobacter phage vB_CsaM_GAP31]MBL5840918.1 hypothetical protein [Enterobacter asburiae]MCC3723145.1 hypothetical protein [Staphylococcus haemolyticus]
MLSAEEILDLKAKGLSNREIARRYLGKESKESHIRLILKAHEYDKQAAQVITETVARNPGAKIFLGDVEVSATLAWVFNRFKAFVTPSHVEHEPYMLTWAGKWLDNPAIISRKLPDYETFKTDIHDDRELVEELWHILDECDIFIAHNARFDKGWANQRFAFHGMKPPSPYIVIDTLAELKSAFSLPSNALEAACNYFQLDARKRHHEGITLWIRCFHGEIEAFEEMEFYNIGDIPTLEGIYLKVRPFMKKHPNVTLFNEEDDNQVLRCVRCNSDQVVEMPGKVGTTYLSKFQAYRCECCGSVMRDRRNIRTKEEMANTLVNII